MNKKTKALMVGFALAGSLGGMTCSSAQARTVVRGRDWWNIVEIEHFPVLMRIQAGFDRAQLPGKEDLRPGKKWTCNHYYAYADAWFGNNEELSDEAYQLPNVFSFDSTIAGVYSNTGDGDAKVFTAGARELIAKTRVSNNNKLITKVRKTPSGHLIVREECIAKAALDGRPFLVGFYVCPNE